MRESEVEDVRPSVAEIHKACQMLRQCSLDQGFEKSAELAALMTSLQRLARKRENESKQQVTLTR